MNNAPSLMTPSTPEAKSARLNPHSALPWKTCRMAGIVRIENVARLQHIAVLPATGPNTIKDAEAIVKAVNHHDALVDALAKMLEAFDTDGPYTTEQKATRAQSTQLLADLRRA